MKDPRLIVDNSDVKEAKSCYIINVFLVFQIFVYKRKYFNKLLTWLTTS